MGRARHGWLDSYFHFSFAEYYNPRNINFGVLRVINDDIVQPDTGFDMHPHRDMEILSYVVDGELSHADSMQNQQRLTRGQVQYMSAGTGVMHSEHNRGREPLRFLQIWIRPDQKDRNPAYGDVRFSLDERFDKWLPIASGVGNAASKAPIRVHADVNIYATILSDGKDIDFAVGSGRQAYLVLIEGEADINGIRLSQRDAIEITEEAVTITAGGGAAAHILVVEMAKE